MDGANWHQCCPSPAWANHCLAQYKPIGDRIIEAVKRFDLSIDNRDAVMGCKAIDDLIAAYQADAALPASCLHQEDKSKKTPQQQIAEYQKIKANSCKGIAPATPARSGDDCLVARPKSPGIPCHQTTDLTIEVINNCESARKIRICIEKSTGKVDCASSAFPVPVGDKFSHHACNIT